MAAHFPTRRTALLGGLGLLALPSAHAALVPNGGGDNGWTNNGWGQNGWGQNGWGQNGWGQNGWGTNGKNLNGGGENGKSAMGTLSSQTPTAIKVQSIQLPSGEVVSLR